MNTCHCGRCITELQVTNSKARELLPRWILLFILLAGGAAPLRGQSDTSGSLLGMIADDKGVAVPGAIATIHNEATGYIQNAATANDGRYAFPTLAPGNYAVTFSAAGFKTAKMVSVVVNVSEDSVLDVRLEVGDGGQTVPCHCTVARSASSSTSTLVDSKTITATPLTTRNFTQVLGNASGAASNVNNAGLQGGGNQVVNVNGNTTAIAFTIDGATPGGHLGNGVPNPDAITQFRIQTSQYDSGYGSHVPTTNLVTKSGANDFHGTLWEFVRNDVFNANAFFQNATGQTKPNLKQNQFGAAVGGPVRKNKLFIFGSYQGTRQVNGLDPSNLSTVILPPLTNDRSAATIGSQFCPPNHGPVQNNPYNTFAGGAAGAGVQVACDGSNISPVALSILQSKLPDGTYRIPTPQAILSNGPNAGLGFSSYSIPGFWNENHYILNTDYAISKKHALAERFFFSRIHQSRSFGSGNTGTFQFTPGAPAIFEFKNYAMSLKLTSVFTSNFVNEFRMASGYDEQVTSGPGIPTATSLGMTPANPLFDEPPQITIQGFLGVFGFFGQSNANEVGNYKRTYRWSDNVSWVHGKHAIRTGMFIDLADTEQLDIGVTRGTLAFQNFTDFLIGQNAAQNGSPTGLSNIDAVTGNHGAGPKGEVQNQERLLSGAAFLQDDIKLTSRFTLNLGLRWEYLPPTFETSGQLGNVWPSLMLQAPIPPASGTYVGNTVAANYDPSTINPHTGQPFGPPPAGVVVRPFNGPYRNPTPRDAFAPRFGFAWQPGTHQTRLAVRGGYGWFYQAPPTISLLAPPFSQGIASSSASNGFSTLQGPFPAVTLGFQLRTPTSRLSDRVAGPDYRIPMLQQWNLVVQLTPLRTLSLDIGYVGSFGTHLPASHVLNQPLLASVNSPVNCGYNGGNPSNLANCITTNTARNAAQRVPILGETPTALAINEFVGASRYNGMQATLRKQAARGLTFQVSYTYSRSMSNTSRLNDQTNGPRPWARANFDRTQRLVFNYSYEFPRVGQNGFLGTVLSGWSMSGVTSIQSGTPLTLTDRSAGSVYGRAAPSTITLCPDATPEDLVTPGGVTSRLDHWINKSAICAAPIVGSDGVATGYGNAVQGIITGPPQNDWDVSVGKSTTVGGIREDAALQFRVEFYNAFNHPQFSNPGTTFGTANFGVITQTSVAPRLIQFGVKYLF
jgi:hypothetical protein